MEDLEKEFTDELMSAALYVKKNFNYRPNRFISMLYEHGGLGTAKRLLYKKNEETMVGLYELVFMGEAEYTLEYIAQKPRYRELFTAEELQICKTRLSELGFNKKIK